jgi:hypothetical protein
MSADESNVSKSTFSDGATFDVGTTLEDGAFDLDNGPFFEDGTAFDDVLLIDDFALEDGTFDFDDAPFFEDGATFFDALFNDDFVFEAPAVAPATAVTPLGTSGSQLWHTKSSSLKCNTGSQMTRPHMKCINCLHSAQR